MRSMLRVLAPLAGRHGVSPSLLGFGARARACRRTDDLRTQLDLFGQVLYQVQHNYVEPPRQREAHQGRDRRHAQDARPALGLPAGGARRGSSDEDFQGDYSGIGIQFDIRDGQLIVISPLEGTPAFRLGHPRRRPHRRDRRQAAAERDHQRRRLQAAARPRRARWSRSRSSATTRPSRSTSTSSARKHPAGVRALRLHDPPGRGLRAHHPLRADHRRGARDAARAAARAGHEGAAARPALQLGRPAARRRSRCSTSFLPAGQEARVHARPHPVGDRRLLRQRPRQVPRRPADRARRPRLGLGVGDRGRRDAGPRPRPGRGRHHVRQGPGAEPDQAVEQRGAAAHHRQVLHAERPPDPARLLERATRRATRRRRTRATSSPTRCWPSGRSSRPRAAAPCTAAAASGPT